MGFMDERTKQAQEEGKNTHSRSTHVTANNIKNTQGNQQTIARIHMRYFKYQRHLILVVVGGSSYETIELILFILGSWLVLVLDSFLFLMLAPAET
jgi:hypothetical protein